MGIVDIAKLARVRAMDKIAPQRFVFHHVPKCGGTSVALALRKRYILSQVTVKPEESFRAFEAVTGRSDRAQMLIDVAALREQMLLYHLFDDIRCISLHVAFSETAHQKFSGHYKFITVLREPVSRFISHFFWSHGKAHAHAGIDEDFAAFLDTDRARRLGATYVDFFSGSPMARNLADPLLIQRATDTLRYRFDVVGYLDDLNRFESDVKAALGVRVRIGHENKARQPATTRQSVITPELMARVQDLCAPDLAIWNAMRGLG